MGKLLGDGGGIRWAPVSLLGALAAVSVLAGCSSTSTSTRSTTTTRAAASSSAPSTTGSPGSSSTSSSSTSSTSTTAAGEARCVTASLAGSVEGSSGAAGTIELTFALRNVSTAACSTGGYPGLQLIDGSGNQLPTNSVQGGGLSFEQVAPSSLSVPVGGSVWFNVGYSDVTTGSETSCPAAAQIQVIPPNDTSHLVVAVSQLTACGGGTLHESALFGPGSPATGTTAPPSP